MRFDTKYICGVLMKVFCGTLYKLQSRKHLNDWGLLRNGLKRGSNEPDFGVERDAEFFMDIVLYGVGECGNVFSGGSSEIGEYKWL